MEQEHSYNTQLNNDSHHGGFMRLKDVRIGTRLGTGFGILGLLMVTLAATGIVSTSMMNSRLEQITQVNDVKI